MTTYRTPDVYVEEISVFPPSVAEVSTAVPAFVGYTEKAQKGGASLALKPTKVSSLLQYQQYFGGAAKPSAIKIELNNDNSVKSVVLSPHYYMYDSLRLFFDNGGGECYIASVGTYGKQVSETDLVNGLEAIRKEDEPTILVVPDAVLLDNSACINVQTKMLTQCGDLGDRVAVLDVRDAVRSNADSIDTVVTAFRDNVGMNNLKYGAAYFPYLETSLPVSFRYKDLTILKDGSPSKALVAASTGKEHVELLDNSVADFASAQAELNQYGNAKIPLAVAFSPTTQILNTVAELSNYINVMKSAATWALSLPTTLKHPENRKSVAKATLVQELKEIVGKLYSYDLGYASVHAEDATGVALEAIELTDLTDLHIAATAADNSIYGGKKTVPEAVAAARGSFLSLFDRLVSALQDISEAIEAQMDFEEATVTSANPIYQAIIAAVKRTALTIPPSGAIAGVYATVDRTRGVWKAPANISLNSVVAPAIPISNKQQESLNIDVQAGKSINAIRTFAGKGVLVWGARTLAGNDNEWRYVPVRRFFNTAEESIKKSTYWAVFEPNDANTWVKVRSMIENYLTQKWRDGALAGAKPADAFFVKCGLGVTMSPQDVLEGYMNVEIGMAVVRPAEFIVLKFSHKMQTS